MNFDHYNATKCYGPDTEKIHYADSKYINGKKNIHISINSCIQLLQLFIVEE